MLTLSLAHLLALLPHVSRAHERLGAAARLVLSTPLGTVRLVAREASSLDEDGIAWVTALGTFEGLVSADPTLTRWTLLRLPDDETEQGHYWQIGHVDSMRANPDGALFAMVKGAHIIIGGHVYELGQASAWPVSVEGHVFAASIGGVQ